MLFPVFDKSLLCKRKFRCHQLNTLLCNVLRYFAEFMHRQLVQFVQGSLSCIAKKNEEYG